MPKYIEIYSDVKNNKELYISMEGSKRKKKTIQFRRYQKYKNNVIRLKTGYFVDISEMSEWAHSPMEKYGESTVIISMPTISNILLQLANYIKSQAIVSSRIANRDVLLYDDYYVFVGILTEDQQEKLVDMWLSTYPKEGYILISEIIRIPTTPGEKNASTNS